MMLRACSILLLLLGCASSAAAQSAELEGCPLIAPLSAYSPSISAKGSLFLTPQVAAKLESAITAFILNNSSPLYAVSVVHEDQTVFTSGLATTPFMIGSVTKTFTALGALMLRERGLLSLDDPIKKFLPDFSIITPYEPHDITLRELMGQVSGMPRELCAEDIVTGLTVEQCPVEEADVLKSVAKMQLIRPTWSREPSYSNLGFSFLGHAWEKATSPPMSWEEFLQEEIFKPLGLNSTGVDLTNVKLPTNETAADYDIGWSGPAGNVYSSATDLAKYLIFLLKASPPLISAATIREWTNSRTIFPDGNGGFALPWELLKVNASGDEFLISKSGKIGSYETLIVIHPPTQLGVSILRVVTNTTVTAPGVLLENLMDILIPTVETATLDIVDAAYGGHYVCEPRPPSFSPSLNATVQPLGGYIDVTGSPSVGLSLFLNVSLLIDGKSSPQVAPQGLLLKNATENEFWIGFSDDCGNYFGGISAGPSTVDPNAPGSDYLHDVKFDLQNKTLLWISSGSVCVKQ